MSQPVLRTARLRLDPLSDAHVELEAELDADAEVLRYIFGRARSRDEVVAAHPGRMATAGLVDGLGFWMAFTHEDDPVGLMMLPPSDGEDGRPDDPTVAELGYRVFRPQWRRGYATEAGRALLAHAFDAVGERLVLADTMAVNVGSRAVLERLGMRHVRTFHPEHDDPLPGTEHGEVEYALTREEWQATRPLRSPTRRRS